MAYPKYGDRREGVSSARTYFYTDEQKCDDNLETLMECIRVAGESVFLLMTATCIKKKEEVKCNLSFRSVWQ